MKPNVPLKVLYRMLLDEAVARFIQEPTSRRLCTLQCRSLDYMREVPNGQKAYIENHRSVAKGHEKVGNVDWRVAPLPCDGKVEAEEVQGELDD